MGKVIGGGLPVGAYGGRRDIMSMVAPQGPMYQAGTLSGNPLAMTAGGPRCLLALGDVSCPAGNSWGFLESFIGSRGSLILRCLCVSFV